MSVNLAPLVVGLTLLAVILYGLVLWFLTKPTSEHDRVHAMVRARVPGSGLPTSRG